jgi:hypothetical protein
MGPTRTSILRGYTVDALRDRDNAVSLSVYRDNAVYSDNAVSWTVTTLNHRLYMRSTPRSMHTVSRAQRARARQRARSEPAAQPVPSQTLRVLCGFRSDSSTHLVRDTPGQPGVAQRQLLVRAPGRGATAPARGPTPPLREISESPAGPGESSPRVSFISLRVSNISVVERRYFEPE